MVYYACMIARERLSPETPQLSPRSLGGREGYPRYRHPDTGIIIIDVLKEVHPERTKLIPIFEADKK